MPAVVEQAQLNQFLFQMFNGCSFERVGHFVEKEIGKLLAENAFRTSNWYGPDGNPGPIG